MNTTYLVAVATVFFSVLPMLLMDFYAIDTSCARTACVSDPTSLPYTHRHTNTHTHTYTCTYIHRHSVSFLRSNMSMLFCLPCAFRYKRGMFFMPGMAAMFGLDMDDEVLN